MGPIRQKTHGLYLSPFPLKQRISQHMIVIRNLFRGSPCIPYFHTMKTAHYVPETVVSADFPEIPDSVEKQPLYGPPEQPFTCGRSPASAEQRARELSFFPAVIWVVSFVKMNRFPQAV